MILCVWEMGKLCDISLQECFNALMHLVTIEHMVGRLYFFLTLRTEPKDLIHLGKPLTTGLYPLPW